MTATEDMSRALMNLTERYVTPPCGDRATAHLWTSELPEDRAQAAPWCTGCPIAELCWAYAIEHDVTFGVWAGRDATEKEVRAEIRAARQATKQQAAR